MKLEKKPKTPKRVEGHEDEYCPPLLFEEILPRLSVKSLMKCKLVCKKWLHYITKDSLFIHNHLRRQSQAAKLSLVLPPTSDKIYFFDNSSNWAQVRNVSLHANKVCGTFSLYYVIGSCNGLVCVYQVSGKCIPHPLVVHQDQRFAIMLWNPETGEARDVLVPPLPYWFYQRPGEPNLMRKGYDYPVYGFGYDKYLDDYKVVRVVPTQPTLLNFDVFSLNSGEWRRLEKGLSGYTVCGESSESVLLNGCFYWLVLAVEESSNNAKHRCILSFDLRDEEFRIIDVLEHRAYFDASLFRHRLVKWKLNCLAYLSFPYEHTVHDFDFRFQIVLDSNGNVVIDGLNASSARGLVWPNEPPVIDGLLFGFKWKFCGVSHGQIFVEECDTRHHGQTAKLVVYDSFGCAEENIGRQVLMMIDWVWNDCGICAVHDYVPSLVSVYPDRKMMTEVKRKKMEAEYWVDVFWKMVGLNKQQFGLAMIE